MAVNAYTPIHQCYFLGQEAVDPILVFTKYLVRNPQYARQRKADCEVNIYVVDHPVADRLACPATYLRKITTTMGAIRAAATALTGEDFSRPAQSAAQIAARKLKKQAKKVARAGVEAMPQSS
jgi:hypothetical protein